MSTPQQETARAAPAIDDEKDEGKTAPGEIAQEQAIDAATGLAPSEEAAEPVELTRFTFDSQSRCTPHTNIAHRSSTSMSDEPTAFVLVPPCLLCAHHGLLVAASCAHSLLSLFLRSL